MHESNTAAALAHGSDSDALACLLMRAAGGAWGVWTPVDSLRHRLAALATAARDHARLAVSDAHVLHALAPAVERCILTQWLPPLSHVDLGRPRQAWRDPSAPRLPLDEAAAVVDAERARRRRAGSLSGVRRRMLAMLDRDRVLAASWTLPRPTARAIALHTRIPLRSVQRHLAALQRDGLLPAPTRKAGSSPACARARMLGFADIDRHEHT